MRPSPPPPDAGSVRPVSLQGWDTAVSGQAELRLSCVDARGGSALRLDFDFHGGGGFVVARKALDGRVPEAYTVRFRLRGESAAHDLELKLADPSGRNVWRRVIKGITPSPRWRRYGIPSREIEFAWGPSHGGTLAELGAIEFAVVVSAGSGQGQDHRGWLEIADLSIDDDEADGRIVASASSAAHSFTTGIGAWTVEGNAKIELVAGRCGGQAMRVYGFKEPFRVRHTYYLDLPAGTNLHVRAWFKKSTGAPPPNEPNIFIRSYQPTDAGEVYEDFHTKGQLNGTWTFTEAIHPLKRAQTAFDLFVEQYLDPGAPVGEFEVADISVVKEP